MGGRTLENLMHEIDKEKIFYKDIGGLRFAFLSLYLMAQCIIKW